jgi:hypothetical protein
MMGGDECIMPLSRKLPGETQMLEELGRSARAIAESIVAGLIVVALLWLYPKAVVIRHRFRLVFLTSVFKKSCVQTSVTMGEWGDIERWGYTVKTPLAAWIDEQVSSSVYGVPGYFAWFTLDLDAAYNPPTSNPIAIYKNLVDATQSEDLSCELIRELLARLLAAVYYFDLDEDLRNKIIFRILGADFPDLMPEIWKINLGDLKTHNYTEVRPREFVTNGYALSRDLVQRVLP